MVAVFHENTKRASMLEVPLVLQDESLHDDFVKACLHAERAANLLLETTRHFHDQKLKNLLVQEQEQAAKLMATWGEKLHRVCPPMFEHLDGNGQASE
jgi:hypothetical protein